MESEVCEFGLKLSPTCYKYYLVSANFDYPALKVGQGLQTNPPLSTDYQTSLFLLLCNLHVYQSYFFVILFSHGKACWVSAYIKTVLF